METEKEIKRGYVKWTDENGVFHKEPLVDHKELFEDATPEQQLAAEEVRRLNAAAAEEQEDNEEDAEQWTLDKLHALQGAPKEILTADQLPDDMVEEDTRPTITEVVPSSGAEEPAQ